MSVYLSFLSEMIIPLVIFLIVGYGLLGKRNIFDDFMKGAENGFQTVIKIMPTLIGLMVAIGVLRASGFLDMAAKVLGKLTVHIGIPAEIVPLIIVRMFSASAANGIVTDLFKNYGPDSHIGYMASILMSCTETVFYTITVYFGITKVKKTRWTLPGALFAMAAGVAASVVIAGCR